MSTVHSRNSSHQNRLQPATVLHRRRREAGAPSTALGFSQIDERTLANRQAAEFLIPAGVRSELSVSRALSRVYRSPFQHTTAAAELGIGDTGGGRGTARDAMPTRSRSNSPTSRRPSTKTKRSERRAPRADDSSATVVGVRISHPDRVIYPDLEMSKIGSLDISSASPTGSFRTSPAGH